MAIVTNAYVTARFPQVGSDPDTDLLTTVVEQAQVMAESWCGISFDSGAVTEYHDAFYHDTHIYLGKWNVDTDEAFTVYYDRGWDWASALDSDGYELDAAKGILYLSGDYTPGPRAWKIVYTGGWSNENAPEALKSAVATLAAALYSRINTGGVGVEGDVVGEGNVRHYEDLPTPDITAALERYRRSAR